MQVAISEGGRFAKVGKPTKTLDKIAQVELELEILRQAKEQAKTSSETGQSANLKIDKIILIQRRWRARRLARQARERLSSWVQVRRTASRGGG
jgi:hypothetical protein